MKNKYNIAVAFGMLHGLNDFVAGYLLAHLSVVSDNTLLNTTCFLVYSILAFAGQLPIGFLLDSNHKIKSFSFFAVICLLMAIALAPISIFMAIIVSGVASAFVHVSGGTVCYLSDNKNSSLSGIFTAPGVIGLISGGIFGSIQESIYYIILLVIPLAVLLFFVWKMSFPKYIKSPINKDQSSILDTHDAFMLLLLAAIAFRSLFWNILHIMCFKDTVWLWGLGISAALGKLIGGYITYKVNWRKFVFVSIITAVIILNFSTNNLILFCIGVALLQSAVPITLLLMQNYMQSRPATATALSLGIAIVLAGLPTYIEQFRAMQSNIYFLLLISLLFLVPNIWILKWRKPNILP